MTTHVSLDLETWGKRPGCDIRSIGAVVFDPVAGTVSDDTFYIATDNPLNGSYSADHHTELELDLISGNHRRYPLHRDPETVKWWNDQSDEAQAAFSEPVDLREGLVRFAVWLETILPSCTNAQHGNHESLRIWANDPHFDVSILAEAYHAVGLPVPWHYRAPRSMRTVVDLSGLTRDEYVTHGTAHNALDDAIAQAMTVCKCYERLGLVTQG